MTVFIVFRRGYYLLRLASGLVPFLPLKSLVMRWSAPHWIQCALYFTVPCTSGCRLCKYSQATQRKSYHVLTVRADDVEGVRAMVDEVFEKPEAWLFLELPGVNESRARAFFDHIQQVATYNFPGFLYNFLPWPFGTRHGVQADNNWKEAKSFFCSEMLTAFVQTHGFDMKLTPCLVTPQLLLSSLIQHHPQLAGKQKVLIKGALVAATVC